MAKSNDIRIADLASPELTPAQKVAVEAAGNLLFASNGHVRSVLESGIGADWAGFGTRN